MSAYAIHMESGLERRSYPRRYWNAFISGSLVVHLMVAAVFYNASLFTLFDSGAPKPSAPDTMYVGLVEPEEKQEIVQQPVQPVKATQVRPVKVKAAPRPVKSTPEQPPTRETVREVKEAEDYQPVPANRDDGVVVVIKGTKKTVYAALPRDYGLKAVSGASKANGPSRDVQTEKGVENRAISEETRKEEFNMYSTAGKPLNVPTPRQAGGEAATPGDEIPARRPALAGLSSGGEKPKDGSAGGATGAGQPQLTSVAKSATGASEAASGNRGVVTPSQETGRPGPSSSPLPKLQAGLSGSGQPGQQAGGAAPSGGPSGGKSEKQLALAGRGTGKSGAGLPEPNIGPKTLAQEVRTVVEVPLPTIYITSPVDRSEIDAYRDRIVTITGETKNGNFSTVRIRLNSGMYEVPVKDGKFTLQARIENEQNIVFAEGTEAGGNTFKSRSVRFRAANLVTKDIVIKVSYKTEGVSPALDCRFKPHPLASKREPGMPDFRVMDKPDKGAVEVVTAKPGIYSIGIKCPAAPGKYVTATFEVALYGYDAGRMKIRRIGPVKLRCDTASYPVRILMPECVFWEEDGWFTGVLQGGSGTTKYKEPEGIIWKEDE